MHLKVWKKILVLADKEWELLPKISGETVGCSCCCFAPCIFLVEVLLDRLEEGHRNLPPGWLGCDNAKCCNLISVINPGGVDQTEIMFLFIFLYYSKKRETFQLPMLNGGKQFCTEDLQSYSSALFQVSTIFFSATYVQFQSTKQKVNSVTRGIT